MTAWAAPVYALDKRTAEVCRDMQIHGFKFDVRRAEEMARYLEDLELQAARKINHVVGYDINPRSPNQLQWAFFDRLKAPVYFISSLSRRPSLGVDAMRGYAACAREDLRDLAVALLEYRRARKLRRTYVEGIVVGPDGRVHPTWLNYGTVSGRFSCQGPNLMNLPHPTRDPTKPLGGIRSLYVASPGHHLIYWDYSQLEMRVAAYFSGDERMIQSCESSDLHAGNAKVAFEDDFDLERYLEIKARIKVAELEGREPEALPADLDFLRQIAKSAGFAICYGAEAKTVWARIVADGKNVPLRKIEAMLRGLRRNFATYYRFQNARLLDTIRTGHVATPLLGRRRIVGHDPDATCVMNFPIQGGAADVENRKLLQVLDRLDDLGLTRPIVPLVAQVHDANVLECPDRHVDTAVGVVRSVCAEPVEIASSGKAYQVVFPISLEVIDRWH